MLNSVEMTILLIKGQFYEITANNRISQQYIDSDDKQVLPNKTCTFCHMGTQHNRIVSLCFLLFVTVVILLRSQAPLSSEYAVRGGIGISKHKR